jgi:nicotinamide mononucleotide transporter
LNLLEILAAVFGLIAVYLTANKNVWGWPVGLVNVVLFGLLYYRNALYANMWLQLLFLILSIYGWIEWVHSGSDHGKIQVTKWSGFLEISIYALVVMILVPGIYFLLINYTEGLNKQQIFLDALTTSMSIIAQYMMARKIVQCWVFWIMTNILYITMNLSLSLYIMCGLYVLFIILSISGYRSWKNTALN